MGKKTSTTTSQVQIPPEVMARYNAVNTRAEEVASKPFQKYGTEASDFVAQINQQQQQGIQNVNAAAGAYQPYIDAATGATVAGMDQANPGELDIQKYMSPYIQNVADTTGAMLAQENERAQSGSLGTAISSGAFGGDRAGIAAANLSQQQNLAYGKTMADIYNQGYGQAVGTAQQQQGVNLGAEQANLGRLTAGGAQLAGLGMSAQQAGLAGAEAQINAGTLEQQTEQAGKTALVNQFMQEQGYPFQVAQFLANIATGTGALSGSTTATTQPAPFFSDRRLKHDVKRIGKTDDGLPIYSFKYKGDEKEQTHVGFMADEVEKVKPEAVGVHPTGYKTVDYAKATENSMGGGVAPQRAGEAFADGGVAGPYGASVGSQPNFGGYVPQASLPVGDLIVADPAYATNAQKSMAQQLAALASLGESAKEIKGTWDWAKDNWGSDPEKEAVGSGETARDVHMAYGGGINAQYLKPQQGGLVPNTDKSYLTDTLASQDKSDKPKLDAAPGAGGGGSSPAGDIAALAKVGLAIAGIPLPFRYGGAAGYADGGAPVRDDEGRDLGAAIRALNQDAVGYKPGMVDPGLAAAVGMTTRPTGVAPASRYPELPTQEDLDRRYRESSAQPDRFPNEPTSPNRYTPLAMDYGRPLNETQLGATNTLVPRQYMFDGPRGGVAAGETSVGVDQGMQTGAAPAGGVALPRPNTGPARDLSFRLPATPTGALAQPMGGLAMPTGQPVETVRPQPRPEGLAQARTVAPMEPEILDPSKYFQTKILKQESGYRQFDANGNPLTSPAGAVGIAQVMEGTGPEAARLAGVEWDRDRWLNDAEYNAQIGEAYFLDQYRKFGDLGLASAAYNAGPGAVSKALRRAERRGGSYLDYLPEETQNYVLSTSGAPTGGYQGEPQQGGLGRAMLTPDKPYEDRSMAGKMFYNEDGTLNRNAILSGLTGVGAMLSSPSQFFLPSLGLGLQGFAGSYAGLEKQAADVGFTKAETERANVATQTSRFFTIGPGGIPLVALDGGGTATLDEFLSSPELKASGNPVLEAQIREEAARRAGTSAAGGGTLYDTPLVQGYIDGEAETASMDLTGSREASNLKYAATESAAEAARSTRATTLLQADAVANLVSEDATLRSGALGQLKLQAIRYANELLRLGGYPPITGADDAQMAEKAAIVAGLERTSGSGQQSFEALSTILNTSPNVAFEPEANAKLMATLMLSQQRAIDMAGFMREYRLADGNTYNLVNEAGKAFDEVYGRRNLAEEQALTALVLNAANTPEGSDEAPMKFLMDPGVSSAEKNLMIREILSASGMSENMIRAMEDANGQIDMARYFGG